MLRLLLVFSAALIGGLGTGMFCVAVFVLGTPEGCNHVPEIFALAVFGGSLFSGLWASTVKSSQL